MQPIKKFFMSTESIRQSYEDVPYPDFCYTQTHPDRLATLATLLGLTPPAIENGRVLEIGCAVGGNLIPMAYGLPDAQFVGIDISPHQIKLGQETIQDLGLKNVTLQVADILDIDADFGQFDYIVAHGIYSWVPAEVRDKLLAICQENLSPNGIAYISYNVLPGWHMLGALRDMMLYHIRDVANPQERAVQAQQFVDFLLESASPDDPYGTLGKAFHELLQSYNGFVTQERGTTQGDAQLLLHDELAPVNDAVYFHEFIDHAQQHGLQYLIEAELSRVMPNNFPPDVAQQLAQMAKSTEEMEQYMDFLRNRSFRQTLLCHAEVPLKRSLNLTPDAFFIATYAVPVTEDMNIHETSPAQFQGPDGSVLKTDHPVTKAAMLHLAKNTPVSFSFRQLLEMARQQVYGDAAAGQDAAQIVQDAQLLAANILKAYGYSSRLVELHVFQPHFVREVSEKPVGSPLARRQVLHGNSKVTNLRHERVSLDDTGRFVLPLLDGTQSQVDIVAKLLDLVGQGEVELKLEEDAATGSAADQLTHEVAMSLQWLARAALLVA
jgi:methyltransferase-like protein/SAM-dependent methyltransferase